MVAVIMFVILIVVVSSRMLLGPYFLLSLPSTKCSTETDGRHFQHCDRTWVKARGRCLKGASLPPAGKQRSLEAAAEDQSSRDHCPEGPPAVHGSHPSSKPDTLTTS